MEEALARVARRWTRWNECVRKSRVGPRLGGDEIASRLGAYDFERPRDLVALTEDVADLLEQGTLHATHPRYFGLFVPGVGAAGVVADALAAACNPQLGAWWHGPAACEIERITLEFFRDRIGFPPAAFGTFTTGGSEANLTGVLAALAARFPSHPREGIGGQRPILYASDQAHDSFVKVARTAGLGERALHRIPSDARHRMDLDALGEAIARDRAAGHAPFLVVGTAGTTGSGAIDPLGPLAFLCRKEGLWLHVDAAWGGIALLSKGLRSHLSGLESADSVTWDAHKTLPVPMGAGMFFSRERRFSEAVFSVATGYVPATEPGTWDAYQQTLQWSRRFIGLKVFMTLAERGAEGVSALIDHQAAMADLLREELREGGWVVTNDTPLPLVCFTRSELDAEETSALVRAVVAEGEVWLSEVRLSDGRRWLRACITHHDVRPGDVRELVKALDRARR